MAQCPGDTGTRKDSRIGSKAELAVKGDFLETAVSERGHVYPLLRSSGPSWGRAMLKIPHSRAGPHAAQPKYAGSLQEVNVRTLRGIGEVLRPRQEAADLFPAAAHEAGTAYPPRTPPLEPQLHTALPTKKVTRRKSYAGEEFPTKTAPRAAEAEKVTQRKSGARAPFHKNGQFALCCLRYNEAGGVAGAWGNFGGTRATLAFLSCNLGLIVPQGGETVLRYEKLRNAEWDHSARKRGNVDSPRKESAEVNQKRLTQRSRDQQAAFYDQARGQPPAQAESGPSEFRS